jgi:terminase, large subunit
MHELFASSDQREWLAQLFESLPDDHVVLRPSEWAEEKRHLPASVTSLPGKYRFDVAPYLREPLDCLSVDSPIREVVMMKGAQIGATVGILENAIGYVMDHVRTAPCMLVTADAELAQLRMESYVTPMIEHSHLTHLIQSSDATNTRKTGKTDRKIEWIGGGFLIPFGAQNANKLRSVSIQFLLRDEIDGWPDVVGKDGDPLKLVAARTAAYEQSRKILDISTPLLKGQSKIARRFAMGDQRHYFVRCLHCGYPQVLRWRIDGDGGVVSGIVWETQDDVLVPDSVRYLCVNCHRAHTNEDKTKLLDPAHGAEWRPTAQAVSPFVRSYHVSALYSPVGMQSWTGCVAHWLEAWDQANGRARDVAVLQTFYNNVLGAEFEQRGEKLRFEAVSGHRRSWYRRGEIPNVELALYCGSPVLFLTLAVDVHGDCLKAAVFGWCRDRRVVLVDYFTFQGDTEQIDAGPWLELQQLLEERHYVANDGREYGILLTMIDSGYRADHVYRFCAQYAASVYPVKGREASPKHQRDKEFLEFKTPTGQVAFGITVDFYKDRWSAALKREWIEALGTQPPGHFNAPMDLQDHELRELTAETKVAVIDIRSGKQTSSVWKRPSGAANELWDCLIYANAAVDIFALVYCKDQLGLEATNWVAFWEAMCADHGAG